MGGGGALKGSPAGPAGPAGTAASVRRAASAGPFASVGRELAAHLPYSVFGAALALALAGVFTGFLGLLDRASAAEAAGRVFHSLHPPHLLLSAAATTAVFRRRSRGVWKGILVGTIGAAGICGVSDVLIPYLGGRLLGVDLHLHLCLLEHPHLAAPFILAGVLTGLLASDHTPGVSFFSHSGHVLVSSAASVMYLVSFGFVDWSESLGAVFVIVVAAVLLPCCLSDIVFPVLVSADKACPPAAGSDGLGPGGARGRRSLAQRPRA